MFLMVTSLLWPGTSGARWRHLALYQGGVNRIHPLDDVGHAEIGVAGLYSGRPVSMLHTSDFVSIVLDPNVGTGILPDDWIDGSGQHINGTLQKNTDFRVLDLPQKDSCAHWHAFVGMVPSTQSQYQVQLDTLQHYIESCTSDNSHDVFAPMDGDVQFLHPEDTLRYDRYRNWLISVLYLNTTDQFYFCACMQSIMKTYRYGASNIPNASLTIMNYLMTIPACNDAALAQEYQSTLKSRHDSWLSGDTTKPEDTTLPSLDQLGLGFLLNRNASPTAELFETPSIEILDASPNPFTAAVELTFSVRRVSHISIGIFDELGRQVWGDEVGKSFDPGRHILTIHSHDLPFGTLYARFVTGFAEVRTVKLVHRQ